MRRLRRFGLLLVLFSLCAIATGQGNPAPTITITPAQLKVGNNKITASGTYNTQSKGFQSITLFATPASGGVVFSKAVQALPAGASGNWGPMDVLVDGAQNGIPYTVWAVLTVGPINTPEFHGTQVFDNKLVMGNGATPAYGTVSYHAGMPKYDVDANKIYGTGLYTLADGWGRAGMTMYAVPDGGGPFSSVTITDFGTDANNKMTWNVMNKGGIINPARPSGYRVWSTLAVKYAQPPQGYAGVTNQIVSTSVGTVNVPAP